jgi:hypothetical protein
MTVPPSNSSTRPRPMNAQDAALQAIKQAVGHLII